MKILIAGAAVLLALQQERVELRWKFEKGQLHRFRVTQKTQMDGGVVQVEQQMATTYSHAVTDVDGKGGATLRVKYEAVAIKASGIQEQEYDSEKDKQPPDDPTMKMMARLVGQEFTLKMTPWGRVTEVTGFDKILDHMTKDLADDNPMMKQMLKQMFSDDSTKSMMQQMYTPLPETPVRPGESWSHDFTMQLPMVGKAKLTIQSKLGGVKDSSASIDHDMKMEFKGGEDPNNPLAQLVEVKDMKGKASSVFSIDRGLFLSYKGETTMKMAAAGQQMEVKSVQEVRLLDRKGGKDY